MAQEPRAETASAVTRSEVVYQDRDLSWLEFNRRVLHEAQDRIGTLYRKDPAEWTRKAIINVAGSGRFSTDRTISEYARDIWNAKPCPVP